MCSLRIFLILPETGLVLMWTYQLPPDGHLGSSYLWSLQIRPQGKVMDVFIRLYLQGRGVE